MADFNKSIPVILEHEGGYVNDPVDAGGATNYGISLRFLKQAGDLDLGDVDDDGDIDVDDIKQLSPDQAAEIYKRHFWDKYRYGVLPQDLATKVFDLSVNMGPRQAHKLLQRSCRSVGITLTDDGIIGPRTLGAIDTINNAGRANELLAALRSEAAGFYRVLVAQKPIYQKFIRGWLNRAYF